MSKVLNILCLVTLILVLLSCEGRRKERVKASVQKFYNSYKNDDLFECKKTYPNFSNLEGKFYKTDELKIKSICKIDKEYIVFCENIWTNPFGKTSTNEMRFYLRENRDNKEIPYIIYDSKNFISFNDMKIYKFASNIGAITQKDSTDYLKSSKIEDVKPFFEGLKNDIRSKINNGFSYAGFNWKFSYYSDYASGHCTVTNSSGYPVNEPRYTIRYRRSKNGEILATDDGVVKYGFMGINESKSVNWFTSNLPNGIHWAEIDVYSDVSDDWIEDIIIYIPCNGDEYKKYKGL